MLNSDSSMNFDRQNPPSTTVPSFQSKLLGTHSSYDPRTDYSPKAFIKAMKRCWALNSSFFTNDEVKIAFTATRLIGNAEKWINALDDRDHPCLENWELFEEHFLKEFSTTRTEWQLRIDLCNIKQNHKSIGDYTSSFRALANQLNFADEALLSLYYLGLNPSVQDYIESLQAIPSNFPEMVSTCLDYGSRHQIRRPISSNEQSNRFDVQTTQPAPSSPVEPYSIFFYLLLPLLGFQLPPLPLLLALLPIRIFRLVTFPPAFILLFFPFPVLPRFRLPLPHLPYHFHNFQLLLRIPNTH